MTTMAEVFEPIVFRDEAGATTISTVRGGRIPPFCVLAGGAGSG